MFDQLFRRRAAVRRHLSAPLLEERLEYLQYCANQGYTLSTLSAWALGPRKLMKNVLGYDSTGGER